MTELATETTEEIEHTFEIFHSQGYILSNAPESTTHDIKIQQYLQSEPGVQRRVRWTIQHGVIDEESDLITELEHTRKHLPDSPITENGPQRRLEDNEPISRNEFHSLCKHQADPEADLIIKDRLTFLSPHTIGGKRPEIEIDIFRLPVSDRILCEVEIDMPQAERFFPSWLKSYRNVNGNDCYSNQRIARGSLG